MVMIQFGQPHDVEKAVALLRQLAPFVLRLGSGGRSQKAVQALVSKKAEDWQQRLAEGRLSAVPGSEESEDLPSSSANQAVSRGLLD